MREAFSKIGCRRGFSRAVLLAALIVVAALLRAPMAHAQAADGTHFAIVVGNGGTTGPLHLPSAKSSAIMIADRLAKRGFTLIALNAEGACARGTPLLDATRQQLLAVLNCLPPATQAPKQAIVVFVGHSFGYQGKNVLLGSDAPVPLQVVAETTIELDQVSMALARAMPAMSAIVVDGWRESASRRATSSAEPMAPPLLGQAGEILVTSAEPGRWAEAAPPRREGQPTDFAARFVELLDGDLARWVGERSGKTALQLLVSAASAPPGAEQGAVFFKDVVSADPLGQIPKVDDSLCGMARWRAGALKSCSDLAASYQLCGNEAAIGDELRTSCEADWAQIMRQGVRAALPAAMRENSCAALNAVKQRFEKERAARLTSEFQEVESLSQYKCALERSEQQKRDVAEATRSRSCKSVQNTLGRHRGDLEAEAAKEMRALAKQVCCAEIGLGKECLQRNVFISRAIAKLQTRGCTLGATNPDMVARTTRIIGESIGRLKLPVDFQQNGVIVDEIWSDLEKIEKPLCTCNANEIVQGSNCVCKSYQVGSETACLNRNEAVALLYARLQQAGCQIDPPSDRNQEKLTQAVSRLRQLDKSIGDGGISIENFPKILKVLSASATIGGRICAVFDVVKELRPEQARAVDVASRAIREQSFAAVAVATTCAPQAQCAAVAVAGLGTPAEARAQALAACEAKAAGTCVLGAEHRAPAPR